MPNTSPNQPDVCAHLQPVKDYILQQGATIEWVGTPWSHNCRHWMYFKGVVLDGDGLKKRFNLPDFIVVHQHRGTHDGHEQGLVCSQDHDALMGPHAQMAPADAKVIS